MAADDVANIVLSAAVFFEVFTPCHTFADIVGHVPPGFVFS